MAPNIKREREKTEEQIMKEIEPGATIEAGEPLSEPLGGGGQPSKGRRSGAFDEARQNMLCALLSAGWSRRRAALHVGIDPSTVRKLALRDPAFLQRLLDCELKSELTPLTNLMNAGKQSWRASAWLLERQFPQRYSRRPADLLTRQELADCLKLTAEWMMQQVEDESMRTKLLAGLDTFIRGLGLVATRLPDRKDDEFWHEEEELRAESREQRAES